MSLCAKSVVGVPMFMVRVVIERKFVWPELQTITECGEEAWSLGGDFNITRWVYERFPVGRSTRGMRQFNAFIDSANLMEIPLQNGKFIWSREGGTAARSLLDRFFINSIWDDEFENSRVTRKARTFFDHFPLLLEAGAILWGPSPFRFCNSWL